MYEKVYVQVLAETCTFSYRLILIMSKKISNVDCKLEMTLLPPRGNFADIVYLREQSFLHRMRDVCTL